MKHLFTQCLFLISVVAFGQTASFTSSPVSNNNTITVCQGSSVLYTNTSTGTNASTNYSWTFQGGNPASANQVGPHNITYNNPGNYITTLNLGNGVTTQMNISVVANNYTPSLTIPNSSGYSTTTSNGITIFRRCGNFNSGTFSFTDPAFASYPAGTTFNFIWGDNTPNDAGNPNPITHIYNGQGNYNLTYQVTFPGGCTFTQNYNVFVGNNAPTFSLSGLGPSSCVPNPYSFQVGTQGAVPAGTVFQIIYNDGTPTTILNGLSSNPQTINHVFAQSSCGINSTIQGTTYPNSYAIQVLATNGCNPLGTFGALGPITISESVHANIGMSPPNNSQCVNQITVFTDSSNHGNNVNGGSCDSLFGRYWTITPNSGFTTSGNLGSSNGYLPWLPSGYDFTMWSNGSDTLPVTWNTPGNYQITLFVGNQCGIDTANIYQLTVSNCQIQNQLIVNPSTVNQIVCNGNSTIPVNWNSNQPNTTTTWILTANPNIVGAIPSGTVAIPAMTLTNTSNIPQNIVYTATSTANGLTVTNTYTITVNPAPQVNFSVPSQTICSGTSSALVTVSSPTPNAVITWTATTVPASISGVNTAIGGSTIPSFTLINNSAAVQVVQFSANAATGGALACPGGGVSYTITVNPMPQLTLSPNQVICSGITTLITSHINSVASGNFTYSLFNAAGIPPTIIGYPVSGSGQIPAATITNLDMNPYTLIYTLTPTANGCSGTTATYPITVYPAPSVLFSAVNQTICSGQNTNSVNISSPTPGVTINWNIQGGLPAGLGNVNVISGTNFIPTYQNVTNSTNAPITIGFTAFAVSQGPIQCSGISGTYLITINPLPSVFAGNNQTVCNGSQVTLTASGAASYLWNNGVQNGVPFTPNSTQTYVVTVTNANGCQNYDTVVVTVNNPSSSIIDSVACAPFLLNGQTYNQSGTYSQTIPNVQGCDSSITLNLTINSLPTTPIITVDSNNVLSISDEANCTFQWVFCNTGFAIAGEIDTLFTPTTNGVYAVQATNDCGTSTSQCVTINNVGLSELGSMISVFPNPTFSEISVMSDQLSHEEYTIHDQMGRAVGSGFLEGSTTLIDLGHLSKGVYILKIQGIIEPVALIKE